MDEAEFSFHERLKQAKLAVENGKMTSKQAGTFFLVPETTILLQDDGETVTDDIQQDPRSSKGQDVSGTSGNRAILPGSAGKEEQFKYIMEIQSDKKDPWSLLHSGTLKPVENAYLRDKALKLVLSEEHPMSVADAALQVGFPSKFIELDVKAVTNGSLRWYQAVNVGHYYVRNSSFSENSTAATPRSSKPVEGPKQEPVRNISEPSSHVTPAKNSVESQKDVRLYKTHTYTIEVDRNLNSVQRMTNIRTKHVIESSRIKALDALRDNPGKDIEEVALQFGVPLTTLKADKTSVDKGRLTWYKHFNEWRCQKEGNTSEDDITESTVVPKKGLRVYETAGYMIEVDEDENCVRKMQHMNTKYILENVNNRAKALEAALANQKNGRRGLRQLIASQFDIPLKTIRGDLKRLNQGRLSWYSTLKAWQSKQGLGSVVGGASAGAVRGQDNVSDAVIQPGNKVQLGKTHIQQKVIEMAANQARTIDHVTKNRAGKIPLVTLDDVKAENIDDSSDVQLVNEIPSIRPQNQSVKCIDAHDDILNAEYYTKVKLCLDAVFREGFALSFPAKTFNMTYSQVENIFNMYKAGAFPWYIFKPEECTDLVAEMVVAKAERLKTMEEIKKEGHEAYCKKMAPCVPRSFDVHKLWKIIMPKSGNTSQGNTPRSSGVQPVDGKERRRVNSVSEVGIGEGLKGGSSGVNPIGAAGKPIHSIHNGKMSRTGRKLVPNKAFARDYYETGPNKKNKISHVFREPETESSISPINETAVADLSVSSTPTKRQSLSANEEQPSTASPAEVNLDLSELPCSTLVTSKMIDESGCPQKKRPKIPTLKSRKNDPSWVPMKPLLLAQGGSDESRDGSSPFCERLRQRRPSSDKVDLETRCVESEPLESLIVAKQKRSSSSTSVCSVEEQTLSERIQKKRNVTQNSSDDGDTVVVQKVSNRVQDQGGVHSKSFNPVPDTKSARKSNSGLLDKKVVVKLKRIETKIEGERNSRTPVLRDNQSERLEEDPDSEPAETYPRTYEEFYEIMSVNLKDQQVTIADNKYGCLKCKVEFKYLFQLGEHLWSKHSVGTNACPLCTVKFELVIFMYGHMMMMHGQIKCQMCPDEVFDSRGGFQKHVKSEHPYFEIFFDIFCPSKEQVLKSIVEADSKLRMRPSIAVTRVEESPVGKIFLGLYSPNSLCHTSRKRSPKKSSSEKDNVAEASPEMSARTDKKRRTYGEDATTPVIVPETSTKTEKRRKRHRGSATAPEASPEIAARKEKRRKRHEQDATAPVVVPEDSTKTEKRRKRHSLPEAEARSALGSALSPPLTPSTSDPSDSAKQSGESSDNGAESHEAERRLPKLYTCSVCNVSLFCSYSFFEFHVKSHG